MSHTRGAWLATDQWPCTKLDESEHLLSLHEAGKTEQTESRAHQDSTVSLQ